MLLLEVGGAGDDTDLDSAEEASSSTLLISADGSGGASDEDEIVDPELGCCLLSGLKVALSGCQTSVELIAVGIVSSALLLLLGGDSLKVSIVAASLASSARLIDWWLS